MEKTVRKQIKELITQINPFDEIEKAHQADAIAWIDSSVEIFRIERPATPPKHLVCYTVFVDSVQKKILLLEHRKSLLLLPGGGHVDKNELPFNTVLREIQEEMNEDGFFLFDSKSPLFITHVETVGLMAGHIDVDLWYVFKRDSQLPINDHTEEFKREFGNYGWYTFNEVLAMDISRLDLNMHRFVKKLQSYLNT